MAKKYRPISIPCEQCGAIPGQECYSLGAGIFHASRISGAVRKSVEAKKAEMGDDTDF